MPSANFNTSQNIDFSSERCLLPNLVQISVKQRTPRQAKARKRSERCAKAGNEVARRKECDRQRRMDLTVKSRLPTYAPYSFGNGNPDCAARRRRFSEPCLVSDVARNEQESGPNPLLQVDKLDDFGLDFHDFQQNDESAFWQIPDNNDGDEEGDCELKRILRRLPAEDLVPCQRVFQPNWIDVSLNASRSRLGADHTLDCLGNDYFGNRQSIHDEDEDYVVPDEESEDEIPPLEPLPQSVADLPKMGSYPVITQQKPVLQHVAERRQLETGMNEQLVGSSDVHFASAQSVRFGANLDSSTRSILLPRQIARNRTAATAVKLVPIKKEKQTPPMSTSRNASPDLFFDTSPAFISRKAPLLSWQWNERVSHEITKEEKGRWFHLQTELSTLDEVQPVDEAEDNRELQGVNDEVNNIIGEDPAVSGVPEMLRRRGRDTLAPIIEVSEWQRRQSDSRCSTLAAGLPVVASGMPTSTTKLAAGLFGGPLKDDNSDRKKSFTSAAEMINHELSVLEKSKNVTPTSPKSAVNINWVNERPLRYKSMQATAVKNLQQIPYEQASDATNVAESTRSHSAETVVDVTVVAAGTQEAAYTDPNSSVNTSMPSFCIPKEHRQYFEDQAKPTTSGAATTKPGQQHAFFANFRLLNTYAAANLAYSTKQGRQEAIEDETAQFEHLINRSWFPGEYAAYLAFLDSRLPALGSTFVSLENYVFPKPVPTLKLRPPAVIKQSLKPDVVNIPSATANEQVASVSQRLQANATERRSRFYRSPFDTTTATTVRSVTSAANTIAPIPKAVGQPPGALLTDAVTALTFHLPGTGNSPSSSSRVQPSIYSVVRQPGDAKNGKKKPNYNLADLPSQYFQQTIQELNELSLQYLQPSPLKATTPAVAAGASSTATEAVRKPTTPTFTFQNSYLQNRRHHASLTKEAVSSFNQPSLSTVIRPLTFVSSVQMQSRSNPAFSRDDCNSSDEDCKFSYEDAWAAEATGGIYDDSAEFIDQFGHVALEEHTTAQNADGTNLNVAATADGGKEQGATVTVAAASTDVAAVTPPQMHLIVDPTDIVSLSLSPEKPCRVITINPGQMKQQQVAFGPKILAALNEADSERTVAAPDPYAPKYATTSLHHSERAAPANREPQEDAASSPAVLQSIQVNAHTESQDALFAHCLVLKNRTSDDILAYLTKHGKLSCIVAMVKATGVTLGTLLQRMCDARESDSTAYVRTVQQEESLSNAAENTNANLSMQCAVKVSQQYARAMRDCREVQPEQFLFPKDYRDVIETAQVAYSPLTLTRDNVLLNEHLEDHRETLAEVASTLQEQRLRSVSVAEPTVTTFIPTHKDRDSLSFKLTMMYNSELGSNAPVWPKLVLDAMLCLIVSNGKPDESKVQLILDIINDNRDDLGGLRQHKAVDFLLGWEDGSVMMSLILDSEIPVRLNVWALKQVSVPESIADAAWPKELLDAIDRRFMSLPAGQPCHKTSTDTALATLHHYGDHLDYGLSEERVYSMIKDPSISGEYAALRLQEAGVPLTTIWEALPNGFYCSDDVCSTGNLWQSRGVPKKKPG